MSIPFLDAWKYLDLDQELQDTNHETHMYESRDCFRASSPYRSLCDTRFGYFNADVVVPKRTRHAVPLQT